MSKLGALIMAVITYCCFTSGYDMMVNHDLMGFGLWIIGLFAACAALALAKG